jgi:hypothetical protein
LGETRFGGWVDTVNHKLKFKQANFQSFGRKISKIHNSHTPTSEEEEECSSPQQPYVTTAITIKKMKKIVKQACVLLF